MKAKIKKTRLKSQAKPVKTVVRRTKRRATTRAVSKPRRRVVKNSLELAVCYPKKLLVPHEANQYRPHLIRWQGLTVLLALILLGQGVYNFAVGGQFNVLGRTTTTSISGLVKDTNLARQKQHLPPLKLNTKLDQAAYAKAQDMLKNDYWSHVSPSGVQPWTWLTKAGYNYNKAGENLAKNYPTSQATLNAWLASPRHRANVLSPSYTDVGFAVVEGQLQGQDTSLVVAMYGEPESSAVLASTSGKNKSLATRFNEPAVQSQSFAGSIGSSIQALSPATLGAISLLVLAVLVTLATYSYRDRIPKKLRKQWLVHQGLYKASALLLLVLMLIMSTGAGQI